MWKNSDNFNVTQFLKTGAIVTENKEDCDIINNIIYKNKSSSLICETKESDIPHNTRNVVKIINDNGKYILELIELIEDFISEDDYIISNHIQKKNFLIPFIMMIFKNILILNIIHF